MNPFSFSAPQAVAAVVLARGDAPQVLGTAFAFTSRTHFLTATHCLPSEGFSPGALQLHLPAWGQVRPVTWVCRHPSADLAVLRVDGIPDDPLTPFRGVSGALRIGDDFRAFGFPQNVRGPARGTSSPRLFKGHYQGFADYEGRWGHRYKSGEMSVPAPAV